MEAGSPLRKGCGRSLNTKWSPVGKSDTLIRHKRFHGICCRRAAALPRPGDSRVQLPGWRSVNEWSDLQTYAMFTDTAANFPNQRCVLWSIWKSNKLSRWTERLLCLFVILNTLLCVNTEDLRLKTWGCPQDFIALLWGLEGGPTYRTLLRRHTGLTGPSSAVPPAGVNTRPHGPGLPLGWYSLSWDVFMHCVAARSVKPSSLWLCTDCSLCAYLKNTKSAVVTTICTYLQSRPAFQPQAGKWHVSGVWNH